jgi:hypothetical protein
MVIPGLGMILRKKKQYQNAKRIVINPLDVSILFVMI